MNAVGFGLLLLHFSKSFQQSRWKSIKDLPDECFTAELIKDDTRIFHKHVQPIVTYTDLNIRKGWYRFSGMPDIPANSLQEGFPGPLQKNHTRAPNFCGTNYPGILMSSHPMVNEGIVPVVVCFKERSCYYLSRGGCECRSKRLIYVRNCIRHYIYWLVPTASEERYCTGLTSLTQRKETHSIECTLYKTLNDPDRVWDSLSPVSSEREEGWVRFGKKAGHQLASKCIMNNESRTNEDRPCGARYRGWLIDSHPSVQEGRVRLRVCFSYNDNCACAFYSSIAVRNCGAFFVYHLERPPISEAKYCGAPRGSLATISDVKKPQFLPNNICNISRTIFSSDRLWSNTNPALLKCDSDLYGVYKFVVSDQLSLQVKEGCNKTDTLIKQRRCAAQYQGFMEGVHPTVSEGYVQRIICFQSKATPCECDFTAVIGVQNCGDSYAYDLQGVSRCDARYCMTIKGVPNLTVTSLDESVEGIPTNYEQFVTVESDASTAMFDTDSKNNFSIIVLFLGVVLLIICVLFILLLVWICCIVRPLYKEK